MESMIHIGKCNFPFITTWVQRKLINQLAGNTCGSHGTKVTIKYYDYHKTTFGALRCRI